MSIIIKLMSIDKEAMHRYDVNLINILEVQSGRNS